MEYIWIACGGALGAVLRHAWVTRLAGYTFPYGTLTVNIAGAFLIGLIVFGWNRVYGTAASDLFLRVGLCGGFTTFSSFSLDTVAMLERGDFIGASGYIIASVAGCLLALTAARYCVGG